MCNARDITIVIFGAKVFSFFWILCIRGPGSFKIKLCFEVQPSTIFKGHPTLYHGKHLGWLLKNEDTICQLKVGHR